MADEFVRGTQEAGNEVEKVTLRGKDIRFCKGCLVCQKTQECVIKDDDAPAIVRKMYEADAICFATPIYYYEMSGQMKTLLDRANPLGLPFQRHLLPVVGRRGRCRGTVTGYHRTWRLDCLL